MKLSAIVVTILTLLVERSYCTKEYPCEKGWKYFEASCYKAGIATEVYPVAEIKCLNMGGHLATIHTEKENQFVTSTGVALASSHLQWVGMKKIHSRWTWADGSSSNFRYWAPSQPAQENCAATNKFKQYKWHYTNCYREADYVCEKKSKFIVEPSTKPTTKAPTTTTTKSVTCGSGWELFTSAKSCYKVGKGYKTFAAAEEDCQVEGAHVVSINSPSEQEFVVGLLPRRHWLGMTKYNGKNWIWTDGTFLGWSKLEDDIKERKCAMMRSSMQNSGWEATDCDREELYICEKPAV